MARPKKIGLDYFPLDVDFYSDVKVRKLMRNNGGGKALAVYTVLLCSIYESGYYMVWDSDSPFILSEKLGFEEGYLKEVTKYCVSVGLFDKDLFEKSHILTSRSIQVRYFTAKRLRNGTQAMPYVYDEFIQQTSQEKVNVAEGDIFASITMQNESYCSNNDENNGVFAAKTHVSATKTPIIAAETPIKKSKVKDKSSLRSDLPSSSSTATSRVREGDVENPKDDDPVDVQAVVDELKNDRDWLLSMQQRHGIEAQKVVGWLNAFVVECDCRGTRVHVDKSDVMRHFNDWLVKQIKPKRGDKGKATGPTPPNYQELWVRAKAELCSCVSAEQSAATFDLMEYVGFNADKIKLVVSVPGKEVFHRLESKPYFGFLQVTLRKFFGQRVCLGYKFRNVSKSQE